MTLFHAKTVGRGPSYVLALINAWGLMNHVEAQLTHAVVDGRLEHKLQRPFPIRDLNSDGIDDILISGQGSFFQGIGFMMVVSGLDGRLVWGPYYPIQQSWGTCAPLDDFDGDGLADIAVGIWESVPFPSEVRILSGADEQLICTIPGFTNDFLFAKNLGPAGDVNGDGLSDLVVAGPGLHHSVYLGPSGQLAYRIPGPDLPVREGVGIGDITGDGRSDLVVPWGISGGVVTVHSGANGALLQTLCALPGFCAGRYGVPPVALGDVNADGVPDFAVSNPDIGLQTTGGGFVRVFSGADFSVLHELWGRRGSGLLQWEGFGAFLAGGRDINGDGVGDLVVGSQNGNLQSVMSAVSGRTGQILFRVRPEHWGGAALVAPLMCATLDDLDGDGFGEWAIGDANWNALTTRTGRIMIFRGAPLDAESVCDGSSHSGGHAARLVLDGPLSAPTRELQLVIEEGVPSAPALLVYGPPHAPTPLGAGTLCLDALRAVRYATPFALDAAGAANVHADWGRPELASGPTAWSPGSTWVVQALFRDVAAPGSPWQSTNAMRVRFGP